MRAATGMVLWVYVALHLSNHALGLVSLDTAEGLRRVLHGLWHSWPGTGVLYGAFALHVMLAFVAIWERRTLRMPALEALRILLGLVVPLLLAAHLVGTRFAQALYGVEAPYGRVVPALIDRDGGVLQLLLVSAAWAHGCIGLHLMFRDRPQYQRWFQLGFAAAVLLPVLAALGMLSMWREIVAAPAARAPGLSAEQAAMAARLTLAVVLLHLAGIVVLVGAHALNVYLDRTRRQVLLRYPGRSVRVPLGWTVLEASRSNGLPHMSLCGGRARCSTCRVQVTGPEAHVPPPGADELRTLRRVSAPTNVRLACQLRPLGDLSVVPLFAALPAVAARRHASSDREVAVLFVDLRGWSGLAEAQWPHDLVYVLDRYFALVGEAVRSSGGVPNQFIGDSVMAIFGLDCDLPTACRRAFDAARRIDQGVRDWNADLLGQFGHVLDFGIGLHAGHAVVAEVGYGTATSVTAVGEVVNTASRLQDQTKEFAARMVASLEAWRLAGETQRGAEQATVLVRGRSRPLDVMVLKGL
jgi:adenylate cyclase